MVIAMQALNEMTELGYARTMFIENLSHQFIAVTGCGVYAYLDPVDVNGLFNNYVSDALPIDAFIRQCVKDVLK